MLVEYEVEESIATIRLNRPSRLNAISPEMYEELARVFQRFVDDSEASVGILTGAGTSFCAGRDLKSQAEAGRLVEGQWHQSWNMFGLPETPKPLVAAVNGYAIGAGWFMVAGCDIRVASTTAVFAMGEVPTGVIGPYWLGVTEILPWAVAVEAALLGEHIPASRLYALGGLNAVVGEEELMPTAREWARKFLRLPPVQMRQTKELMRLIRPKPDAALQALFNREVATLEQLRDTQESVEAFAEKRQARYTGR
jgi:enoyl-CoA hydratase/carnithine racemase